MIDKENVYQCPDQIIDIANWYTHQDYEVFPVGARDKSLRVCPTPAPFEICLAGHRYLFKEAIKSTNNPDQTKYPDQYWAEVISFRIGRMMGLRLPPVFVAIDSKRNEPGTLNEWFLGYSNGSNERFIPGGDYMQRYIPNYDRKKGKQHNFDVIARLCRVLERRKYLSHDWKTYWGLCLCFDALIGNTDRHQENWGLVWEDDGSKARFSPYFDNGTSLSHELKPEKMQSMMRDPIQLKAYLKRGKHQMRWSLDEGERLSLIDGVVKYCQHYPEIKPLLINKLQRFSETELTTMLDSYTLFELPHPFTKCRSNFLVFLLLERKKCLLKALEI